jgi:Animal haem peroxidase
MPRSPHSVTVTVNDFRDARENLAVLSHHIPLAFAVAAPADLHDFDFMFPSLQVNTDNLLPESRKTRDGLVRLGQTMRDMGAGADEDSDIPAAYTYFGQFVDHDVTFETVSAPLPKLLDPELEPLPLEEIRRVIRNKRTATLDLDSVYGLPAPRDGEKMALGKVTKLNGKSKPMLRPSGKDDDNDLPREGRSGEIEHDRAALTGDPRNDENTIIQQLHVAFLRAHNALIGQGRKFDEAQRILRQHYQHIVIHDFLKQIAGRQTVDRILQSDRPVYDAMAEPFFLPLEFTVAAFRFGHSLIRSSYDHNLNFNDSGQTGTEPAELGRLFTFTALSGQLGDHDTLPENWIIQWENFVDMGASFKKARRIDTKLVEPLFHLPNLQGVPEQGDGARLAVRNLLRGYLLRMPTGQAVARELSLKPLTPEEIKAAATSDEQIQALSDGEFLERTPLWFYILAEAAARAEGRRLGPVGGAIVAEVLVGLVRRSKDSILRTKGWKPTLPSAEPGLFELPDLLKFAGALS